MTVKRKLELDAADDVAPVHYKAKQLKLIPFPNYEPDTDSPMSDVDSLYSAHHTRFPSNASTLSTDSGCFAPSSPQIMFNADGTVELSDQQQPPSPPVGLLQPSGNFTHHGSHCAQIPKLRVACSPGLNGQRTLWSFCESCGSISMVNND